MDDKLANLRAILLDFDGTICRLFEHYDQHAISLELHDELQRLGVNFSPDQNFFEVFEEVQKQLPSDEKRQKAALCMADHIVTEAEVQAVKTAIPVDGFTDFITFAENTELRIGIATNNSRACVAEYLKFVHVEGNIPIAGRNAEHPEWMKPNSYSLQRLLYDLQIPIETAVYIGDSIRDVECAAAVHCPFIGMGPTTKKFTRLKKFSSQYPVMRDFFELTNFLRGNVQ